MRAPRLLAAALALAAAACGPDSGGSNLDPRLPPGDVDADRDGVVATQDCDDHDASAWSRRTAYRDVDGDGAGSTQSSTVCAGFGVPAGYVENWNDCDDTRADAWHTISAFPDDDGDGFGRGAGTAAMIQVCVGYSLPQHWSSIGGDCDDTDEGKWQNLSYLYRDEDGDGYTTYVSGGVVCSGAALPPGYTNDGWGIDCDDADASVFVPTYGYVDADRDGVGAGGWVSVCAGTSLPAGYATTGDDCAIDDATAWRTWWYSYVDRDGDGFTRYDGGSVCYGTYLPEWIEATWNGDDCDDSNPLAWKSVTGYVDADEDGFGAGDPIVSCTTGSLPDGQVAQAGDCAPEDDLAWRWFSYSFRDEDRDGRTVPQSGRLCVGSSDPGGYLNAANGLDCDDLDEDVWASLTGYADADTDGVGAGEPKTFCTAGVLPAGFVAKGTDCAVGDSGKWQMLSYAYADRDGDGVTARESGSVCAGAVLPDPYRAAAAGNDCDDADTSLYRYVVLYPDRDGDGVGAPPREVQCLGATLPEGYSVFGWDPDDGDARVASAADDDASVFTVLF